MTAATRTEGRALTLGAVRVARARVGTSMIVSVEKEQSEGEKDSDLGVSE